MIRQRFSKEKKTYRVAFNEITKTAVSEAIQNPREISDDLWNAYVARRTLDYLMGYDISEFLWKKVSRLARGGRVQSPALRLIVEREREIDNYNPTEYWLVALNACKDKNCIDLDLVSIDGNKVKQKNITNIENQTMAEEIKKISVKRKKHSCEKYKTSDRHMKPKAPFTTASLQQTAYSTLGFSVRQTSSIAQRLYQGMQLGGDNIVGLISYMRTDSTTLSKDCLKDIDGYLSKNIPNLNQKMNENIPKGKKCSRSS